jgi:GNAT superfamily N-acetyltransferase
MTNTRQFDLLEATWPAASLRREGPWLIREGKGGGQRVSAASLAPGFAAMDITPTDITRAEDAMAALGQPPLFMVRSEDTALDAALDGRGYRVHDPVVLYSAPCETLATPAPPRMAAFPHWPPMAIAADLWAEAGIGPDRLAVMSRVKGAKTAILGRQKDRASGVAFVACDHDAAMLHALEVTPNQRRQGSANNIMRCAAVWALEHGAKTLTLAVTEANAPARALYASLEMQIVGKYHYRKK